MVNSKTVSKIATYIGIAAVVFAIILALVTFFIIQIATSGAPTEYIVLNILSSMIPYLFIAASAFIVAVISKSKGDNAVEEEEALPTEVAASETNA